MQVLYGSGGPKSQAPSCTLPKAVPSLRQKLRPSLFDDRASHKFAYCSCVLSLSWIFFFVCSRYLFWLISRFHLSYRPSSSIVISLFTIPFSLEQCGNILCFEYPLLLSVIPKMAAQLTASLNGESTAMPYSHGVDLPEESYESDPINLHISCPFCKHYNKHRRFGMPRDPAKHARVRCEKCGDYMIGFGRSSTQTTLASVESYPLNSQGKPRPPNIRVCTNAPQGLCVDPPFPQRSSGQLTPLHEQSLNSRTSQSPLEGQEQGSNEIRPGKPDEADGNGDAPRRVRGSARLKGLRTLGRRLREHVRSFNKHIAPLRRGRRSAALGVGGDQEPHDIISGRCMLSKECHITTEPNQAQRLRDVPPTTANTRTQEETNSPSKAITHPPSKVLSTAASDPTSKQERMKRLRREKTLRNEAVYHCDCGTDCTCKHDNSGRATDGDTLTRVPGYPLDTESRSSSDSHRSTGPLRELLTRHIGRHLVSSSSSRANSGATGDSLSQAATQIGSNESMSSDNTRRDSSPRRPVSSGTQSSSRSLLRNPVFSNVADSVSVSGLRPSNPGDRRAPSPLHQTSTYSGTNSRSRTPSSESHQSRYANPRQGTRLASLSPPASMQGMMNEALPSATRNLNSDSPGEESQQVTPTPPNIQTDGDLPTFVPLPPGES